MKQLIYAVLIMMPFVLSAQEFDTFNTERLGLNKSGMLVLGSWAVANIALSPILASRETGWRKSFHQMNGYWNGINLVIAGFGYFNAIGGNPIGMSLAETFQEQHSIEKILLFNAGLDIGYVVGGLYLNERAKTATKHQDRLRGFGRSIMLQGGFLFVFDVILFAVHQNHSSDLYRLVEQVSIAPGHFGMVFSF